MKRTLSILLLLVAGDAFCQSSPNQVVVGQTLQLSVPGAIAGFARPGSSAKVLVQDGLVLVTGRFPGITEIILVIKDSTTRLMVTVVAQPTKTSTPATNGRPAPPPPLSVTPPQVTEQKVEEPQPRPPAEAATEPVRPAAMPSPAPVPTAVWSSTGTAAVSVQEGQTIKVSASGATAVYPIENLHVDVSFDQGSAAVTGKFAGRSQLIIVSDSGVKTIPIEVTPAPPLYPRGFLPPESPVAGRITGQHEIRYISDQQQIQNLVDFTVQGPRRSTQLHSVTSVLAGPKIGNSRLFLPSAFYRIRTPDWDVTFLDDSVDTSPLTLHGSILRGVHVSTGQWRFHGGYSSLATFHGFLLPVQPEGAVGVSYILPVTEHSQLDWNAYYMFTPTLSRTTSHNGAIESLVYHFKPKPLAALLAEFAAGRGGVASAFELQLSTSRDTLKVNYRQMPRSFPSLSIGNVPGLQSALAWTRQLNRKVSQNVHISDQRLLLPFGRQTNLTAAENTRIRLSKLWSLSSGVTHASFSQTGTFGYYSVGSLNLPQAIDFDLAHFGAGFQYQYSRNSRGVAPGHQFRPSVRVSKGSFAANAFAERQTQGVAVESLYSQIPSLQTELLRLGLSASTPQEVQALLQDTSFLLAIGVPPSARLNLVPSRIQTGGSLSWNSRSKWARQMDFSVLHNRETTLLGRSTNWVLNGSYTARLSRTLTISSSFVLLRLDTPDGVRSYPQAQVAIRHDFATLPSFLAGYKTGTVSGTVFEDEAGQGQFRKGLPVMAGVEVVLDKAQRTITDRNGFYSFKDVREGAHVIEIHFQSSTPFWFTGPASFLTSIDRPRNVGIRFATAELVGYLRSDAGIGVGDAHIVVVGNNQRLDTTSDADGRFAVSNLAAGEYEVTADADSLPAGYLLEDLRPQHIQIENKSAPGRIDFQIKALRSIVGTVTQYDATSGTLVPAVGVPVQLRPAGQKASTDAFGKFEFLDISEGDAEVEVGSGESQVIRNVIVPSGPARLRVDVQMGRLEAVRQ